jgi:aquaporin-4
MVWCFGHVSGGHINPAVTVSFLATKRINLVTAIVYVLAQMIGSTIGAGILAGEQHRVSLA